MEQILFSKIEGVHQYTKYSHVMYEIAKRLSNPNYNIIFMGNMGIPLLKHVSEVLKQSGDVKLVSRKEGIPGNSVFSNGSCMMVTNSNLNHMRGVGANTTECILQISGVTDQEIINCITAIAPILQCCGAKFSLLSIQDGKYCMAPVQESFYKS